MKKKTKNHIRSFSCEREDCFECAGGICRLLTEPVEGKPCPFFATPAAVYDSRAKAYVRLKEMGREDLIEFYSGTSNREKSAAGNQKSNLCYLNSFKNAAPDSYAASVYRKYSTPNTEKQHSGEADN